MDGGVTTAVRPQKVFDEPDRESVRRGRQQMSSQPPSVAKARSAATPSRAEAARPPKPTIERERQVDSDRSAYGSRIDQIKKQWFDTVAELRKVTWPDKEATKNLTLVVIGISAALGALLGGLDWILQRLFALI
jgi:preprotein translocase subunit SecE